MTITVKKKAQLIVPESIRRKARIKPGDRLEFKVAPGSITITAKPVSNEDEYTPAQRRVIEKEIAKGLRDVEEGRVYGPFDTAEELIASLKANIKKANTKNLRLGKHMSKAG
jgi:AbrB family looped-hinge helix DNA binding protein